MQTAKQLSLTLVNKPGRLVAVLGALTRYKVTPRALTVMDSGLRSTLRFVPDDPDTAGEALDSLNLKYETVDVLLVEVAHQPGAFSKMCERLAAEHLNIDYAYSSFGPAKGAKSGALAVVKVNDLAKAQRVLTATNGTSRVKKPGRRPVHAR